jgi:hypothetical protein
MIQGLAANLLGAHVNDRTEHGARPGKRSMVYLGDSKIEQLDLFLRGHDRIGRLDIAMHDALIVGFLKSASPAISTHDADTTSSISPPAGAQSIEQPRPKVFWKNFIDPQCGLL